jgi:hypothetical protein
LCERLELHARNVNKTIVVDCHDNRISFGEAGRFDHNRFFLNAEGQKALQDVVPLVLEASDSEEGKSGLSKSSLKGLPTLMARIFTTCISPYSALNGSCVVCSIAAALCKNISAEQQIQIRKLFLAGAFRLITRKRAKKPVVALSCVCSSSG